MASKRPRVLIVNDDPRVGRALKHLVEQANCKVCLPFTIDATINSVHNEVFDSVLIDANLGKWRFEMFGKSVQDGIEFARAYCEFQRKCLIVVFGPETLPYQDRVQKRLDRLGHCNISTMKSPLPAAHTELRETLAILNPTTAKELKPRIEETALIHAENPVFQPLNAFEGLSPDEQCLRRRLLSRRACEWSGKWANFNLHKKDDSSWTVLCDGNVLQSYYGEPLKEGGSVEDRDFRASYPARKELKGLAETKKSIPLFFWNTWNDSVLSKQFDHDRLEKIPQTLADHFGISVAPACAKAYSESEETVIKWCQKLRGFAQLHTLKVIFKNLIGDRERSVRNFSSQCRKAGLNRIVDVYDARVEKLNPSENTAIVELTNFNGDDNFAAPFDLTKLKRKGIKETNQRFEYTVYSETLGHALGHIELTE